MTPYSAAGEMEPCPFCGEQPDNPDQFGGLWMVECPGCGATIDGYDTAKETADNWNRRAPVAVDAAAESKLASIERPEGIPNLPCPGWHEAIEEAAKVADYVDGLRKDGVYFEKGAGTRIRSLLPPGGEGLKK